jgi:methylmalonyl-CoA mutase
MTDTPVHKIRIVTAASLFDGHDAAINIMRRIMQSMGAEVIHLGHNRSAAEIVECAIQEDAQGIAVTSYQGGHVEFFKYMYDLLQENNCGHIKIFGGGGGTILPNEIKELHEYGITRLYSPDDGRTMGLEGMIGDVINQCDFATVSSLNRQPETLTQEDYKYIAQAITIAENDQLPDISSAKGIVLGITGTGGAGKSSVTDEIVRRFLHHLNDKTIAVISVDPSKKKTGGALLGDRIRMNAIHHPRAYMRSLATRESDKAISAHIREITDICRMAGFDLIILETSGIGQSDTAITDYCDVSLYVMTPEYGAASQLEKINMLDYADVIAINKFDINVITACGPQKMKTCP